MQLSNIVHTLPKQRTALGGGYLPKETPKSHDPILVGSPDLRIASLAGRRLAEYFTKNFGGADRDRTGDPLLAKQVLSQLSYSPLNSGGPG